MKGEHHQTAQQRPTRAGNNPTRWTVHTDSNCDSWKSRNLPAEGAHGSVQQACQKPRDTGQWPLLARRENWSSQQKLPHLCEPSTCHSRATAGRKDRAQAGVELSAKLLLSSHRQSAAVLLQADRRVERKESGGLGRVEPHLRGVFRGQG